LNITGLKRRARATPMEKSMSKINLASPVYVVDDNKKKKNKKMGGVVSDSKVHVAF